MHIEQIVQLIKIALLTFAGAGILGSVGSGFGKFLFLFICWISLIIAIAAGLMLLGRLIL